MNKTDIQLKTDIEEELRWDPKVNAAQIGVTVDKGAVTLLGSVDTYAQKWAAEDAAKRVSGVRTVAQDLTVKILGEHKRSDSDIAAAVQNALDWPGAIDRQRRPAGAFGESMAGQRARARELHRARCRLRCRRDDRRKPALTGSPRQRGLRRPMAFPDRRPLAAASPEPRVRRVGACANRRGQAAGRADPGDRPVHPLPLETRAGGMRHTAGPRPNLWVSR